MARCGTSIEPLHSSRAHTRVLATGIAIGDFLRSILQRCTKRATESSLHFAIVGKRRLMYTYMYIPVYAQYSMMVCTVSYSRMNAVKLYKRWTFSVRCLRWRFTRYRVTKWVHQHRVMAGPETFVRLGIWVDCAQSFVSFFYSLKFILITRSNAQVIYRRYLFNSNLSTLPLR